MTRQSRSLIPHVLTPFLTHLTLQRHLSITAYLARPRWLWLLKCILVASHLILVMCPDASSIYMYLIRYWSVEPVRSNMSRWEMEGRTFRFIDVLDVSTEVDNLLIVLCQRRLYEFPLPFPFRCCKKSQATGFRLGLTDFNSELLPATGGAIETPVVKELFGYLEYLFSQPSNRS